MVTFRPYTSDYCAIMDFLKEKSIYTHARNIAGSPNDGNMRNIP